MHLFLTYRLSAILLAGALCAACPPVASAAATSNDTRLDHLVAAERAATASGDANTIIESSRGVVSTALSALAQTRARQGDHAEAASLYKSALATVPSPATELDLAGELLASGNADQGKSLAADVLEKDPKNPRALALSRGEAVPDIGDPTATSLAREGELRRVLANAYNDWGTAVIHKEGDYSGAFLLFQAATHWDPTTPGGMRNLGLAAFRLGRFDASAAAFRSVLDADPANKDAHVLLGLSLFSLQQFREAVAAFSPAADVTMADTHAAYAWAFSLAHTADPFTANHILDGIVDRPMPAQELVLVCQVYEQTENYEHAISCLKKASVQDGSLKKVHAGIGISLIHLSRPAEAVPELRKELSLSPLDMDAQFYLAYALIETSQREEAQKLLVSVVAEQPGNGEAQYQLGKLLAEKTKWPDAIVHLKAAAAAEPANYDIHYQLQNAYRKNGQGEEAARELAIYRNIKDNARAR